MPEYLALADVDATHRCGRRLGEALREHDACVLVGLSGELGAGKTSLVSGVLAASGIAGPIRSPTYTLVEPYELQGPTRHLYHMDLYRLRHPMELEELGVRELQAANNVLLVEWIENAPELVAHCDLHLQLTYANPGRRLLVDGRSEIGRALAATLQEQ